MTGPAHGGLQESPFVSPVPPPSPPPPPSLPPRTRYIGSLKRKKKNRASVAQEDDTPDIGELCVLCGGPLAQSVERGADNAKVVSSRLTWTNFFLFLFFYLPGATPVRMGDAQTQTPSASGRSMQHDQTQTPLFSDHSMQHQIHYPSGEPHTIAEHLSRQQSIVGESKNPPRPVSSFEKVLSWV